MPNDKTTQSDLIATKKASQYGTGEPKFLWFPFLPYKKLVLLQGESGIGKSSFILNIAALLSQGKPMPFEAGNQKSERGDTFYLCKEDDVEEVINPRLIAIGADQDRIHIVDEAFMLDNDCRRLEETIRKLNVRLVIFDPLTSFLGRSHNMNTAQSIGNLMRELSRVAFTTGAIIVIVSHMTKNAVGKEIDRHLGSSDIVNAARSVISVTREDDESDIVTVKHLKSTLAKRANPFYYEIIGNGVIKFMNGIEEEESALVSPAKRDIAKSTLLMMLSKGAVPQSEIKTAFINSGICGWRTVETAKSELNIVQFYGNDNISYWRLPV